MCFSPSDRVGERTRMLARMGVMMEGLLCLTFTVEIDSNQLINSPALPPLFFLLPTWTDSCSKTPGCNQSTRAHGAECTLGCGRVWIYLLRSSPHTLRLR